MLLEVRDLSVRFLTPEGVVRAVEKVDLRVDHGQAIGLVGESGCGKSVTSLSIMGLIPCPPGRIESGQVLLEGTDLLALSEDEMRRVRGRQLAMIFQEPMTSLNPVMTIGHQVAEPLMAHLGMSKKDALEAACLWLERVRIPAARKRLKDYPHQLSGGMRQRVMIAMALACGPKILIADEPTTALDVTIQAQILSLIRQLRQELGMAVMLITHDLGVVAQMTSKVAVMYAGQIVEEATVEELFLSPFHPYTRGLMRSMPRRDPQRPVRPRQRLKEIPGVVPQLTQEIVGCRFRERCPHAFELCAARAPELFQLEAEHKARCWLRDYPERRRRDD